MIKKITTWANLQIEYTFELKNGQPTNEEWGILPFNKFPGAKQIQAVEKHFIPDAVINEFRKDAMLLGAK